MHARGIPKQDSRVAPLRYMVFAEPSAKVSQGRVSFWLFQLSSKIYLKLTTPAYRQDLDASSVTPSLPFLHSLSNSMIIREGSSFGSKNLDQK